MNTRTGPSEEVSGDFFEIDGLTWYRIDNYDLLDPFLVSLVTPDDQWAFISSSGALTAGRRSAEFSLFPYENDDRLHRSGGRTGPLTLIAVAGWTDVWAPFDPDTPIGRVQRSIAKTAFGDRLRFTERHPDLGMTFEYTWATADSFGLVRTCRLVFDAGRDPVDLTILDGLVNVLPAGVELGTQRTTSTLVDAYRRTELTGAGDLAAGLALFTLEALVSDKADPAEALTANVVWSEGLEGSTTLLSDRQVRRFRSGLDLTGEQLMTGVKGAYLQAARRRLSGGDELRWMVVADVDRDHADVVDLAGFLERHRNRGAADGMSSSAARTEVELEVTRSHRRIGDLVAAADGRQLTADQASTVHHFANVLFNCMRGGIFIDDHRVVVDQVAVFIAERDHRLHDRFTELTAALAPVVEIDILRQATAVDDDVTRLVNEYLPLTFSRRHGDPSRPWNTFSIPKPPDDGQPAIGYQGNWRDIFQNWEALLHSYPLFTESVVSKFLSASTVDGHNPYRITNEGIDWEVPEEGSWGNFGYWGDHQIVYLHRLLDIADRFHPGLLESMIGRRSFAYADVPYRLRPHEDLLRDPKRTLDFDDARQVEINDRVAAVGADGCLVPAANGSGVHLATMAEKLVVPALAKLSNLVAGGGIWLNTQRPEWNDANNALVGNGVSVVTLFHLRDYVTFVDEVLARADLAEVEIGAHVASWIREVTGVLRDNESLCSVDPGTLNREGVARERRLLLDSLGLAFERYRNSAYAEGPGLPAPMSVAELRQLFEAAGPHVEAAVRSANRKDGLVHTYWLMRIGDTGAVYLDPLYEMLEGQVAALSSPSVEPGHVNSSMAALWDGDLHRSDQTSFVLYPSRRPPSFVDKNRISPSSAGAAVLALAEGATDLVTRDAAGDLHFAARLRSARHLEKELDRLAGDPNDPATVIDDEFRRDILAAYEEVFDHRSFTGRSQSMYRYEGLGSIYWHMVSKLLFSIQERVLHAAESGVPSPTLDEMFHHYQRVRSGLGYRKTAALQGTFPTDPHSHTPARMGAQQPGMTGQVKEGVLIRWGELGVRVHEGRLRFDPVLLDPDEFLTGETSWEVDDGEALPPGSLGFTYCSTPVVYSLGSAAGVEVTWADGRRARFDNELDRETSRAVFGRRGAIARIDVTVDPDRLLVNRTPSIRPLPNSS